MCIHSCSCTYSRGASAITRFRRSWFIASAHTACPTNSPIRRRPSEISGTHSDSDSEPDPVNMTVSPSPGVPCTENRARTGMHGPGKSSHRSGRHGVVARFVGRGCALVRKVGVFPTDNGGVSYLPRKRRTIGRRHPVEQGCRRCGEDRGTEDFEFRLLRGWLEPPLSARTLRRMLARKQNRRCAPICREHCIDSSRRWRKPVTSLGPSLWAGGFTPAL